MKRPLLAAAFVLAAVIAVGSMLCPSSSGPLYVTYDDDNIVALEEGREYIAIGRVERVGFHTSGARYQWWIYLDSVVIEGNAGETANISCKLICKMADDERPKIGSLIRVRGQFSYFTQATNPGEFDSAQYYHILGIGGVLKKAAVLEAGKKYSPIKEGLFQIQNFFKARLYRYFPEKEASVLCTMLLGEKAMLDSEVKELYKRNGIVHILSISGLHITLLGMGIYKLLRKIGCPVFLSALLGSIVLTAYGIMTGMGISACRAIGMYLIRMLGELVGRTYDMLTALGFMGIILLLQQPEYLKHSGFLLSFGSVCGIGLLLPAMMTGETNNSTNNSHGENAWKKQISLGIKKLILPGLSISLFTLPIHLCFYYEIPVYSVFLNLLVLPAMSIIMAAGLSIMLMPQCLAPLQSVLAGAGTFLLGSYEWLCRRFDKLPGHTWTPGCPDAWQVVIYYLLLAIFLFQRLIKKRSSKAFHLLPVLAVVIISLRISGGLEITFLDVGQGDGILIQTQGGEVYLFDGGSSSEQNIGENTLIPFLKYQGITRIDGIFVSHPDADHYNGIVRLLEMGPEEGLTIKRLFLPDISQEKRGSELETLITAAAQSPQKQPITVQYLSKGMTWQSGDTVFTCIHPISGTTLADTNAYSLCFLVSQGSFTMLLTGDVQGEGETQLYETLCDMSINNLTLLKVAHHGSRNSTSEEFLKLLTPDIAIISCARDNVYGHPHKELIDRLTQSASNIYTTPDAGAITIKVYSDHLSLNCYKPTQM